jgi:hypothetical protein
VTKVGADDYIVRARATASDLSALPREELWPVLAPEAMHGLAGRIVKAIDPYTEADPVGVLANLLTGLGNLIGPNPHAVVQHDEHPLRLNVALVGRTSKGRKGTSWSTPRYLLSQVDADWARNRVVNGLSSGEGLIHQVRDRCTKTDKNGQDVVLDEGVADKRLLIIEPEFAVTLKAMARETNTLSGVMRQAWDSGDLSTLTKHSPVRATGAHISIVAHITEEELRRYLTATERANGFANRFLWLMVRRSKCLPEGGRAPDDLLAPLVADLQRVVAFGRRLGNITRDDDAKAIWAQVYPRLSDGKPGLFGAVISRAEAQVLRLSTIYAVLDQSGVIRPPHLEAALAVWDCAESSARHIFGDRLGSPLADMILAALRAQGPMTRTEIDRLFQGHKRANEIERALAILQRQALARSRRESTAGRAAMVWEAI